MKIDKKLIKELVDSLDEFNLTELSYQDGNKKIKVSKGSKTVMDASRQSTVISSNKTVLTNAAYNEYEDCQGASHTKLLPLFLILTGAIGPRPVLPAFE